MRRYYEVLGLSEDANEAEIKLAYRRAASRLHPDKISAMREPTQEDQAAFREIQEAYDCLSDVEKRVIYDETGATGQEEDPVDGVMAHVFKTLLEEGAPTAFDLLGTAKVVLGQMIDEASTKIVEFKESRTRVKRIQEKVKYSGNEKSPILVRTLDSVISTLEIDIEDHEKAVAGAKMAYKKLNDYQPLDKSAKKPNNRPSKNTREEEMPEALRLLDSMLRGRMGR